MVWHVKDQDTWWPTMLMDDQGRHEISDAYYTTFQSAYRFEVHHFTTSSQGFASKGMLATIATKIDQNFSVGMDVAKMLTQPESNAKTPHVNSSLLFTRDGLNQFKK